MSFRRTFLVWTIAAATTAPLLAQTLTAGPEIRVSGVPFDTIFETSLAAGADGGFLAAWQDFGRTYARAFSPADTPRLAEGQQLSPQGAEILSPPRATVLASGRSVVVWSATRRYPSLPDHLKVAVRILDPSGYPAGGETVLSEGDVERDAWLPTAVTVAAEPGGGFVAAWELSGDVHARRFDAQGLPAGPEVTAGPGMAPSVASLPDGGFALAWYRTLGDPYTAPGEVVLRFCQPDGLPATPETQVADPLGTFGWDPHLSADAAGRLTVAWSEFHLSDTALASTWWVRARRFGPQGQPLAAPFLVAETDEYGRGFLVGDVAARPEGSFLVTWWDGATIYGGTGEEHPVPGNVMARAWSPAGTPLGGAFRVHDAEEGEQRAGEAEATPGGWIVSWSRRFGADGVYARRFSLTCGAETALCLSGSRFRAEVTWKVPATGQTGRGTPIPRTNDTGAFWFFDAANVELLVKVLDGTAVNGHFWVFYGSLTDVEFDLTVTDTVTGQVRTYHNPAGTMASRADTEAFLP